MKEQLKWGIVPMWFCFGCFWDIHRTLLSINTDYSFHHIIKVKYQGKHLPSQSERSWNIHWKQRNASSPKQSNCKSPWKTTIRAETSVSPVQSGGSRQHQRRRWRHMPFFRPVCFFRAFVSSTNRNRKRKKNTGSCGQTPQRDFKPMEVFKLSMGRFF